MVLIALKPLHIKSKWFQDPDDRVVILRGVNLGGSSKIPYQPDGSTQNKAKWPPSEDDWKNSSWIGRPFPRSEAEEHYSRLHAWGFNCLRILTTWEAIEHAGPYEYDEAYLEYLSEMISLAGQYGLYVYIDFHQDVWSRITGGDGAPLWLFDKIGLDIRKFDDAGAAINMQYLWDPNPKKNRYRQMSWGENLDFFPNQTMWTLFFAGQDFTPNFTLENELTGIPVNIQEYLQYHFLRCVSVVAERVKDMAHVIGFDTLNEPNHGFIGNRVAHRVLFKSKDGDRPSPGLTWSPLDIMYVAAGKSFPVDVVGFRVSKLALGPIKKQIVNPQKISLWKDNAIDFWNAEGVWIEKEGQAFAPREDYFKCVNGHDVNFSRDYLLPFAQKVAETIRQQNPAWIIFVEDEPKTTVFPREGGWPENTPENMVNVFHWYDGVLGSLKRFLWPVSLDLHRMRPVWGLRGIQKMYIRQLGIQPKLSEKINDGNCPCLVGEFGTHMDLDKGKSFKKSKNLEEKTFKWQIIALDLMYNALDHWLLSGTQWNYTFDNSNAFGDNWNQEDLSIFSRDQQIEEWKDNINSGGRGIEGFCRPYARFIAGKPIKMQFNRSKGLFRLEFIADLNIEAPTEIFVPAIQYPHGFNVKCDGGTYFHDSQNSLMLIEAQSANVKIEINRA